jgi:hypothetical protein
MIATLTVGLGAFAMVYTVVQKVLLAPLPYERRGTCTSSGGTTARWSTSSAATSAGTDVAALDSAGGVIQDAVALDRGQRTLAGGGADAGEAEEIYVLFTSPDLFRCSASGRCSGATSRRGGGARPAGADRPRPRPLAAAASAATGRSSARTSCSTASRTR